MSSPDHALPEEQDPILELVRSTIPAEPAGLTERLVAHVAHAASAEQRFWFEIEQTARRALLASAAAALLVSGGALWSQPTPAAPTPRKVASSPAPAVVDAPEAADAAPLTASPAEELAVAGPDAALNSTLQGYYWLLGEGE